MTLTAEPTRDTTTRAKPCAVPLQFTEQRLQELLGSAVGAGVGQAMLAASAEGRGVVVSLSDGSTLNLFDAEDVGEALLDHFHWRPPIDWTDKEVTDCVHSICGRSNGVFTVRQIIGKLLSEHPGMIRDFGGAWARLLQHKIVRLVSGRKPNLYELVYVHAWL